MEIKQENYRQKTTRKTKNAWIRCKGAVRKTDASARIQILEGQRRARKQVFGVEYMDLVDEGTSEDVLRRCVDAARSDLEAIQEQIDALRQRQAEIDQKMERKIKKTPDADWDGPSVRVSSAPTDDAVDPHVADDDAAEDEPPTTTPASGATTGTDTDESELVTIDDKSTPYSPTAPSSSYDID